jgi:hypothetical protein
MKEYFKLQYTLTNRKLSDFGGHPVVGYLLLLLVFAGLSVYLFHQTSFAPYVYVLIALYFTSRLSERRRNDFLKTCFSSRRYRVVRVLENLIAVLPFAVFMLYKQQFVPTACLMIIALAMSLLNFNTTGAITLPTPFYKKPFEFTVGFRSTFFLFVVAYALTGTAVVVDNFNLGVASLALVFLTVMSYYLKPEHEYFVWSYSLTPAKFLVAKIKTALQYSFYLCLPVLCTLSIGYFEHIGLLLLFTLLGYLYLVTVILAKYAAFPHEIELPQGILLAIAFTFPPMLVVVIPFFANQSLRNLKPLLQ